MSKILVVDDDPIVYEVIQKALAAEGHVLRYAPDGQHCLQLLAEEAADLVIADLTMASTGEFKFLEQLRQDNRNVRCLVMMGGAAPEASISALREHICDFLAKPFTVEELHEAINSALTGCPATAIEVVSALPEWVELRVPCDLAAVGPLQRLFTRLAADLSRQACEAIGYAFREMLNNAIEHGCKLNPQQRVEVRYMRLKHAVICLIKDPGEGFDPGRLDHAAINNPNDNPLRHIFARNEKGMRAGGFGILLTQQMVDELIYNERHNEILFVKYLL